MKKCKAFDKFSIITYVFLPMNPNHMNDDDDHYNHINNNKKSALCTSEIPN